MWRYLFWVMAAMGLLLPPVSTARGSKVADAGHHPGVQVRQNPIPNPTCPPFLPCPPPDADRESGD